MTTFTFHTPENTSNTEAKKVLDDVQQKYGFVPNLFAYMAEAPYTIEAYTYLNSLLEKTGFTPAQQQLALLAVSVYNQCNFCKVAHYALSQQSKASPQSVSAILHNEEIEDSSDKALVNMVITMVDKRGWVDETDLDAFFAAGFEKRHVYDLILIVTIKTLSNYSNHLTKPKANKEFLDLIQE